VISFGYRVGARAQPHWLDPHRVVGYEGLVTGFGSSANAWTRPAWEATWKIGWALFILGFPVQIVGEYLGRRSMIAAIYARKNTDQCRRQAEK